MPSASALRRAASAGLDLERLKRERPDEYRMLNASEALRAPPALIDAVEPGLLRAFPGHRFFRAPAASLDRVLAFPPLTADQLEDAGGLLAARVRVPAWSARLALYREVSDARGTRREVVMPTSPADYLGGEAWVGPFRDRQEADAWAETALPHGFVHDAMPHATETGEAWFCDVFSGEPS